MSTQPAGASPVDQPVRPLCANAPMCGCQEAEQPCAAQVFAESARERDVREACAELRDALGNPVISGTMEQTLQGQVIRAAAAKLRELQAELAATQRAWREDSNSKALELAKATTLLTDTMSACKHKGDPRGCYRVRCQLGRKCVEA